MNVDTLKSLNTKHYVRLSLAILLIIIASFQARADTPGLGTGAEFSRAQNKFVVTQAVIETHANIGMVSSQAVLNAKTQTDVDNAQPKAPTEWKPVAVMVESPSNDGGKTQPPPVSGYLQDNDEPFSANVPPKLSEEVEVLPQPVAIKLSESKQINPGSATIRDSKCLGVGANVNAILSRANIQFQLSKASRLPNISQLDMEGP